MSTAPDRRIRRLPRTAAPAVAAAATAAALAACGSAEPPDDEGFYALSLDHYNAKATGDVDALLELTCEDSALHVEYARHGAEPQENADTHGSFAERGGVHHATVDGDPEGAFAVFGRVRADGPQLGFEWRRVAPDSGGYCLRNYEWDYYEGFY
ncbi:hypothetical protein [Corynebacterium sphenisci]|uniref:hypothetical protein n=1 Tax=Corynebacterium sphenisci TaxID=191493 RepID=UPI0026E00DA6|nr:hypothetical protein [Corynebacterium sphenisci]MDO5731602.1 hypothetical protein [Corynebacterium sphenisci]